MKTKRIYPLVLVSSGVEGYFDGSSNLNLCGCGNMVLFLKKDHFFYLSMGGGLGSNTKGEFLSFLGLLLFYSLIGIKTLLSLETPRF